MGPSGWLAVAMGLAWAADAIQSYIRSAGVRDSAGRHVHEEASKNFG